MKIKIFCEDRKGKDFFLKLANRLKEQNLIGNVQIKVRYIGGSISTKLTRSIKASLISNQIKFIIVYDAHGRPIEDVREEVRSFIPSEIVNKTCIVILRYEIEEWICYNEDIRTQTPYKTLKQSTGYEKYRLPEWADRLNIDKLSKCPSFSEFLECIRRLERDC